MAFSGRRDSSERTAEDRARAAAERAARRSQPAPPPEVFEDVLPPAPAAEPERQPEPAPTMTAVEDRPPPVPPRRTPTRRRPTARAGAPRGRWRRRIGAVLALMAIGVALYVINATFQPFHGTGTGSVSVKIPKGADAGQIGDLLAARGVVASGRFFELNATLTGRRGGLRPGNYTLLCDTSNGDAIAALTKGPKVRVVPTVNITVPEGLSVREAAARIDKGPLKGRYLKAATDRSVLRRVRGLGAPKGVKTPEGFLFPATYTLVDGSPAGDLVSKQLQAFRDNFSGVDLAFAKRKHLTRYDVLIIASLVEREAQLDKERPLIASVIYNRLRDGMPLGIDATIRYETRNWQRPIRQSELDADTPYNTRLRRGLPPTPIGNPGLKSIKAAAHPATTRYLFFVRKPGKTGEHAFSTTNAQFDRDSARYQASREP
jgi:UPF0755 protein